MLPAYLESMSNPESVQSPLGRYKSMTDLHEALHSGDAVVVQRGSSRRESFSAKASDDLSKLSVNGAVSH
jgi:hypothetical protein